MPQCKKCGAEISTDASYCPKCGTAVAPSVEPRLAYWGERFVAWLIDIVILGAAIGIIRFFVWATWPGYAWTSGLPGWIPFVDFGTSNLVYFLYWILMESIYNQSVGKMIMRIKVSRLDGKPPNAGQVAIESVGKAFLLPIDLILGWILYPRKRQRIFNYLSGTIVTKA